ncbi:ROK family protein [Cohnella sp. LGH]|uniref:ROK family protein n=1 Tax=Cohnella sp. LGH TaxID=1619153 RepID=UPI001ADC3A8A|nr:ROK family protein [Cohnella sp. LGH]QTH41518.1 ROK family protein [Cohnella sp. LGH]
MEYAIGADIGGTKIQIAAVDREGRVVDRHLLPTEAQLGPDQVMGKLLSGIGLILSRMPANARITGIGVGSAGQIDFASGTVAFAGDQLPGWTGTPIKARVEERFGLPTYVDNDANVVAVAERLYGAGLGLDSFLCVALGTGIGGAIVEAGRIVRGAQGCAGELGHVSVDFNGPRCGNCGNNGCVELYASGSGIARLGSELIDAAKELPAWRADSREIAQAWLQGDPQAAQVMGIAIRALAAAIAGYIHMCNPQAVIVGGGVSETGSVFLDELDREVRGRTSPSVRSAYRLLPAYVGNDAGVIGAAAQVWLYGGNL